MSDQKTPPEQSPDSKRIEELEKIVKTLEESITDQNDRLDKMHQNSENNFWDMLGVWAPYDKLTPAKLFEMKKVYEDGLENKE